MRSAVAWVRSVSSVPGRPLLWGGGQLADFDVAEGDGEAVVLGEDVAVVLLAEVGPLFEFACGDDLAELGGEAVVLDDLYTIEPPPPFASPIYIAAGFPP